MDSTLLHGQVMGLPSAEVWLWLQAGGLARKGQLLSNVQVYHPLLSIFSMHKAGIGSIQLSSSLVLLSFLITPFWLCVVDTPCWAYTSILMAYRKRPIIRPISGEIRVPMSYTFELSPSEQLIIHDFSFIYACLSSLLL